VIIAANVLIWVGAYLLGGKSGLEALLDLGAKDNALIARGQIWRLVTPIFLHVDFYHLLFNVYALYIFGPQIERSYGRLRYLCIYVLSGIYGVFLSFVLSPHGAAGASGAIFGLIGTEAVYFYRYRNAFGPHGKKRLYQLLIIVGYNVVYTFVAPRIDIWGHIGGLLAGAALGWLMMPRYGVTVTERGLAVVDRNRPQQWGLVVFGATILLALSTWLAIATA
jgi:rhomboid protease GluP